jgi:hypothetical protein
MSQVALLGNVKAITSGSRRIVGCAGVIPASRSASTKDSPAKRTSHAAFFTS